MPAVSVIMPVYNRAGVIGGAIDSVLKQSFTNFELIVVDDGSTDDTAAVIETVDDPRLHAIRLPANKGGGVARNLGIKRATGPVICFIDSDDRFLPHKLAIIDAYFRANPTVDVVIDSFELIFPPEAGKAPTERRNPEIADSQEVQRAIFTREVFKATPAISARRDALVKVGLFDEALRRRQDMDLLLRLCRACNVVSISSVLWEKHWSADSISARHDTFAEAAVEICRRYPEYVSRPEYRVGLSRDTARHFLRLFQRAQLATASRDLGQLAGQFGWRTTARLVCGGVVEMLRRKRRRSNARK